MDKARSVQMSKRGAENGENTSEKQPKAATRSPLASVTNNVVPPKTNPAAIPLPRYRMGSGSGSDTLRLKKRRCGTSDPKNIDTNTNTPSPEGPSSRRVRLTDDSPLTPAAAPATEMNVSTELNQTKKTKDSKESNETNESKDSKMTKESKEKNDFTEKKESTEKKSTETTDLKELKERISRLSENLMARGRSPSTSAVKAGFNMPIETQRQWWSGETVGGEGNREMNGFKTSLDTFREKLDEPFDKQGWRKSEKSKESKDSKETEAKSEPVEMSETEEKSEPKKKNEQKDVKPVRESIARLSEKLLVREGDLGTDVFQLSFDKNIETQMRCGSEELVAVARRHGMDSYKTGLNDFRASLNEKVEKQKKRTEELVRAQHRRNLDSYKTGHVVFRERLNSKVEGMRRQRFERMKNAATKNAQEKAQLGWVITKDKEGRLGLERKNVSPCTRQSLSSHARFVDAAETKSVEDRRTGQRVTSSPLALASNGVVVVRATPAILPPRLGFGSGSDFSLSRKRRRSSSDSTGSLVEPDNRRVRFTNDDDAPAPARRPKPTPSYTQMVTSRSYVPPPANTWPAKGLLRAPAVFDFAPDTRSSPNRFQRPDAESPLLTLTREDKCRIRKLQELKAEFDLTRARARSIVHQADVIMDDFSPRLRGKIESMGVGPDPTQGLGFDEEDNGENEDDEDE
ncbi:hypothetical protein BZA05DRAFT_442778 [Tricharina praecox]|uniref:uncharacterized protein n=1 Tax=Tricharina praecox TaxID=43433 RepID=UPI00221F5AB4|nr:uncharacterized protein BZA05DRAFT_442778 [Tricharina praecox]KAI5856120.1 hypothetical protein BZA05DRAFT_442778 [Tricharina praecox]